MKLRFDHIKMHYMHKHFHRRILVSKILYSFGKDSNHHLLSANCKQGSVLSELGMVGHLTL